MSRKNNNFYLESLVRTNKDLYVPFSEWQIPYYCTKEIYNTFKGCMRNMFKRSACLPARYPCSWRTETVVLSTKHASNEVTELWVDDFITGHVCPGALWKRMRTLPPPAWMQTPGCEQNPSDDEGAGSPSSQIFEKKKEEISSRRWKLLQCLQNVVTSKHGVMVLRSIRKW